MTTVGDSQRVLGPSGRVSFEGARVAVARGDGDTVDLIDPGASVTVSSRVTSPWSLPDGELAVPASAPRDQWLVERRRGVGSSDIPLLMGMGEGGCEYELWLEKVGARMSERTEVMRRGTWLEPYVVDFFTQRTGLRTRRCGLVRHRAVSIALATPDRLVADGGCLEVKTFTRFARSASQWRGGGIAAAAFLQGQWQLFVTGRSHVWFAAYELDREPLICGPVERDQGLIDRMWERATIWWSEHVVTGEPPPVDLATITDEEIALRWPAAEPGRVQHAQWPAHLRALLAERAEVHQRAAEASERKKEIDQALEVMIGDAEALLIGGRPVVTFKNCRTNPRVNPALEFDHPDIYAAYIQRGSSRRIHICRDWETA